MEKQPKWFDLTDLDSKAQQLFDITLNISKQTKILYKK